MRKRITILSLVFILFAGVLSFAQSDFMESWYSSVFQDEKEDLTEQITHDLEQMDEEIGNIFLSSIDYIESRLADFSLLSSVNGGAEIEAYQQAQIEKLEIEKERLIGGNFSEWKEQKSSMITEEIDEDVYEFLDEILND